MWVKICGNTRLEDCLVAVEAGADAVGFVFAKGKRTVTAAQVAGIVSGLPDSLEKIGVFTSRDAVEISETALAAGLTGIQLHGVPDRSLLETLPLMKIQVLHWRTDESAEEQRGRFAAQIDDLNRWDRVERVLVDSQSAVASGGTGKTFDWEAVAPLMRRSQPPVIAAGGLTPENVADAVRVLRPWGVDVSSGVESGVPGVKDAAKVAAFVKAARSA